MAEENLSNSSLANYAAQIASPAAPEGLQQTAEAAQGWASGDEAFAGSRLGQFAVEEGYVPQAQAWLTGRNLEGTNNGWDNAFVDSFITGFNQALAENRARTYFEDGGTGVATWDHQAKDGRTFKFGDVVIDGNVVEGGNVYDQFDKDTANQMMAQFLFDKDDFTRIYSASDPAFAMDKAINEWRNEVGANMENWLTSQEFQGEVDKTAEKILEGKSGAALVAGSAAGGAVTGGAAGAAIGSMVVPVGGTVVGGAIGGAVGLLTGLVGGWLNRDSLAEQAARAKVMTRLAEEQNNQASRVGTFLQQWGGLAQQMTMPGTQLAQGLVDVAVGEAGDGEVGMYATDDEGQFKRPLWSKPLTLAATLTDSTAQFLSPLNRFIYLGQTGAMVGGEALSFGATGTMFDPRSGRFESVVRDENGNIDYGDALAGIYKIGIDAVQMAQPLALARTSRLRAETADAHQAIDRAAGTKFFLDESGAVVDKKLDWVALIAPSEQMAWVTAQARARRAAAAENRAVRVDDLYQAAASMAASPNAKLKAAMVTGFAEGYEEFVQGLLEPIALDGGLDPQELIDAFLYGTAAGVGLGAGAVFQSPRSDRLLMMQAFANETLRNDGQVPDFDAFAARWEKLTPTQRAMAATRDKAWSPRATPARSMTVLPRW